MPGHPTKISRADGSIITACFVDHADKGGALRASDLVNIIWNYLYYLDLRPNLLALGGFCGSRGRSCALRTLRAYTHTTHLSIASYLIELVDSFRNLRCRMEEAGQYVPGAINSYVDESLAESGVPDLSLKVRASAVEATRDRLLRAWTGIIEGVLEENGVSGQGGALEVRVDPYILALPAVKARCGAGRGRSYHGMDSWCRLLVGLSEMHQLALYSIFIRRHRTILVHGSTASVEELVVNVPRAFETALRRASARADSGLLESLQWFGLAYCCYSGLGMSPVLTWFSTTFGTETPHLTRVAYTPRSVKRLSGGALMVDVPPTPEDYGYHSPGTMNRYSRMLPLDALITSNNIDMTAVSFIGDPWHRASVYSSFYRTLALTGVEPVKRVWKRGEAERIIAVPAVNRHGRTGTRTPMVVTHVELRIDVGDQAREAARDYLRILTGAGTREEKRQAARMVLHILRDEVRRWEDDYAKRVRRMLADYKRSASYGLDCVRGVIVEAYHPIAYLFLFDEVALRDVAFVPGPQEAWNLLYTLMNRLMDADYLRIRFYYLLDAEMLVRDYEAFRELASKGAHLRGLPLLRLSVHTVYNTIPESRGGHTVFRVDSYGIERILQALLFYEHLKSSCSLDEKLHCFDEIIEITKEVIEPVMG